MPSRRAFVAAAALAAISSGAAAQPVADPAQLVSIMERYAAALRSGNVEALVALYTPNGVFMRENMPAAVGRDALRAAYKEVFAALKVDLAFSIQETEVVGDIAWLRSTSKARSRCCRQVPRQPIRSMNSSFFAASRATGRFAATCTARTSPAHNPRNRSGRPHNDTISIAAGRDGHGIHRRLLDPAA